MRSAYIFRTLLVLVLFVLPLSLQSRAEQNLNSQGQTPIAVIELFTSEGCSSCPPADSLLQQIHLKKSSTGQLIVGISEHVTYWNSLGWRDPFSADTFTERQETYASRLSPQGPYTPQMVVNGRVQFVGNDSVALERALRTSQQQSQLDLRIVTASIVRNGVDMKFSLAGAVRRPMDIIAVITDDSDRSHVLRGENSGRSLEHISVARSLTRVGTVRSAAEQTSHVSLPGDFKAGSGHHLILLAQEQNQGAILGAAIIPF